MRRGILQIGAIFIPWLIFSSLGQTDLVHETTLEIAVDEITKAHFSSVGLSIGTQPAQRPLDVQGQAAIVGNLQLGTMSANSTLSLSGTLGSHHEIANSNRVMGTSALYVITADSELTLPEAKQHSGQITRLIIQQSSANLLIIGHGSNQIDRENKKLFNTSQLRSLAITSDGTQWLTLYDLVLQ